MGRTLLALAVASFSLGAWAAEKPLPVTVANPVLPVEVSNADPIPVVSQPAPLWQGTPYVSARVIFGSGCQALETIPAGKVLFVQRVIASFNVAPGRSSTAAIKISIGGNIDYLYVPSYASGPVHQSFGVYDGYQGVLEVGLPTAVVPEACFFGVGADDVRGRLTVTGFLLPASE